MTSMAAAGNPKITGLDYDDHHLASSPTLRFSVGRIPYATSDSDDVRRLIAAVDSAVAARAASGPDVEALEAYFVYTDPFNYFENAFSRGYFARHEHATDITSAHLARWLSFAARRVTGRFDLSVPTVPPPATSGSGRKSGFVRPADAAAVREIRELYAELPASWKAQTVSLTLGDAELTAPVAGAGAFSALTDLFLSHARIEPGEDASLGRMFSSSCCPRLRRLRLEHIDGLHALCLDAAGTLEELWLKRLTDMSVLELDAPGLRSLHMLECTKIAHDELARVSVSAPAMKVLGCDNGVPPDRTELVGATSVRRLEKLCLFSHGFPPGHPQSDYSNAGTAWLLEQCTAADSLDVGMWAPTPPQEAGGGTTELIGLLPRLPAVTDLSLEVWVTACLGPGHRLGHSAARLVARCGSLRHLSVAFENQYHGPCEDPNCFCSPPDGEEANMMSDERLEQLVEAKIAGFRPLPDQMSLVRVLMAMAPALERITVQFEWSEEDNGELPLPCGRGHWARSAAGSDEQPAYEWTPAAALHDSSALDKQTS